MSYILDALKKSEQERLSKEAQQPDASERSSAESSSAKRSPVDGASTIDNNIDDGRSGAHSNWLYLLLIVLMLGAAIIAFNSLYTSAEDYTREEDYTRVEDKEPVVINPQPIEINRIEPIAAVIDTVIAIEDAKVAVSSLVPSLSITSHIFSTQAQRRSIVVNGQRLIEGDYVAAGIRVHEITSKGMVINVNGDLLAISRSRGWKS